MTTSKSGKIELEIPADIRVRYEVENDECTIIGIDLIFHDYNDDGEEIWYESLSERAVKHLSKFGWLAEKCIDNERCE